MTVKELISKIASKEEVDIKSNTFVQKAENYSSFLDLEEIQGCLDTYEESTDADLEVADYELYHTIHDISKNYFEGIGCEADEDGFLLDHDGKKPCPVLLIIIDCNKNVEDVSTDPRLLTDLKDFVFCNEDGCIKIYEEKYDIPDYDSKFIVCVKDGKSTAVFTNDFKRQ